MCEETRYLAKVGQRISSGLLLDYIKTIAVAQYCQRKSSLVEQNMREALSMAVELYGKTDPQALWYMNILEGWLWNWGRHDVADELKLEMDLIIGLDETDLEQMSAA